MLRTSSPMASPVPRPIAGRTTQPAAPAGCLPAPGHRWAARAWPRRCVALALALVLPLAARSQLAAPPVPVCEPGAGRPLAGAYRTSDGATLSILPEAVPGQWRFTHFGSGASHRLHPLGALQFQSAADLESAQPPALRYRFTLGADGQAETLEIDPVDGPRSTAQRLPLQERPARIRRDGVTLAGTLTLPPARPAQQGPVPAVVYVHGSDPVPSAGREWLPHLLASHGIATLVFDKRGAGCSTGQYVQHVGVLADDVVAAVRWLAAQPGIDAGRIGLAGFSQGGWVAPRAALLEPTVRFVAVAYGLAMSMADEDRIEAPMKLRALGLDDASVAEFEALNATLHTLAREGFRDWSAFEQQLAQARARPWFALAARQPSWLGLTLQMGLEQAKRVAPRLFTEFFQPFDDPVPTLEQLRIPMLWLVAGQDTEAPQGPTLEVLARLRQRGQPVSVVVFPQADHGMQDVALVDGQRVRTRYASGYFQTLLDWLRDPS